MPRDSLALLQRRFDETQRLAKLGSWERDLGDFPLTDGEVWWSREVYRQLGYDPTTTRPAFDLYLARVPEPERSELITLTAAALESGKLECVHPLDVAGQRRQVLILGTLVRDDRTGKPLRLLGTMQDITERVEVERLIQVAQEELELRVAKRTAELAASVREFEEFSHSISHDLRAPLRHIDGFTRILQEEHAASLDPEGREHLQRIVRSTARMATLMDGLLEFTRVGQQAFLESALDMEALAGGALEQLRSEGEGRNVSWDRGPLPPAWGDAALVRQVWVQLLSNALKFTRSRDPARITIGAEQEGEDTWYFVDDNGTGFDPQFARRLFTPFQRLHRAEEFEGSGVGLAIARRIVQRHGGRIEAHAEAGRGARVRFCLPRTTPPSQ